MTTSLAVYYSRPQSTPEVKQILLEGALRPSEIMLETSMLEITHLDDKIKAWSNVTRRKYMGRGFSGIIRETGGTDRFVPGDRVCGYLRPLTLDFIGTAAVVDIEKHTVFKVPAYMSDAEACTFPQAFATAWELASRAPCIKRSDRALVIGGTPTALLLLQLLQDLYALENLTVVCNETEQTNVADYDVTVVQQSDRLSDALVESIGGTKFTCIFDCVGGYEALKVWPSILKTSDQGGRYLTIRGDLSNNSTTIESARKLPKNLARVAFGRFTGIDYQFVVPVGLDSNAIEYAHNNPLEIAAPRTFSLDEVKEGYEYLQNLATGGRIAINMAHRPRDIQEYGPDCNEKRQYSRLSAPGYAIQASKAIFRRSLVLLQSPINSIPVIADFPSIKDLDGAAPEQAQAGAGGEQGIGEPAPFAATAEDDSTPSGSPEPATPQDASPPLLEELSFPDAPFVASGSEESTPGSSSPAFIKVVAAKKFKAWLADVQNDVKNICKKKNKSASPAVSIPGQSSSSDSSPAGSGSDSSPSSSPVVEIPGVTAPATGFSSSSVTPAACSGSGSSTFTPAVATPGSDSGSESNSTSSNATPIITTPSTGSSSSSGSTASPLVPGITIPSTGSGSASSSKASTPSAGLAGLEVVKEEI